MGWVRPPAGSVITPSFTIQVAASITREQVFEAASAANPGRATVLIRADKRCQWDFIVAAMNACNKAKIRDYRVTTLPLIHLRLT